MKHQLKDYQMRERNIYIFYVNTYTIYLSRHPILNSRAKHVAIKHYFIRYYGKKGFQLLSLFDAYHQWEDIITKLLFENRRF